MTPTVQTHSFYPSLTHQLGNDFNYCVTGTLGECDQDLGEGHRGAEEGDQGPGHHRAQQGERKGWI